MDGQGHTTRGWTCQACGCNTNQSSDRTCSVCGTSDGASLLRRSGYVARAGLFARSVAARRAFMEDELAFDDDDPLDRVEDVDMAADDEDDVVAALAMEVAGGPNAGRFQETRRQRLLDAARSFGMLSNEFQRVNPDDLLRAATENAASYQPKWAAPLQNSGRVHTGAAIVVGDGERQNVAHLPLGAGEGRALRAADSLPRGTPFSSFSLTPTGNPSNLDRRQRRVFGFRVAFDHPRREQGRSMGGCYLVGVTIASFNSFGERNALQQSPFFWGIEDGGSKFEGSRHASSRGARRGPSHYAADVPPNEAPRNSDNVLFGNRDVVSVVVDFETRSLTFWRNETLLGTLVTNLPRGGNIFPVVVPFNTGVTVAITGMNADPIPFLHTFASDWRQAQKDKEDSHRRKLAVYRTLLICNRRPTPELVTVLRAIYSSYATGAKDQLCSSLPFVAAARLWYRCGMKLSCLRSLMETKRKTIAQGANPGVYRVDFDDFVAIIIQVIDDEEHSFSEGTCSGFSYPLDTFKVGDKVELAEGYERFGDASNGPLQPGNRGTVVEFQQGPSGERHSVRVLFNGRRWWYQPQALLSESSGLTESPAVWFLRSILRAHSYDHTTLQPLWGRPLAATSWQVGDIVAPAPHTEASVAVPIAGRIVAKSCLSSSPLSSRSRDDSVLVEFIDESFGEMTGVLSGEPVVSDGSVNLYTRRVRLSRLVHSRCTTNSIDSDGRDLHHSGVGSLKLASAPDQQHHPVAMISSKHKRLMEGVAELDVSSIEALSAECRRNAAALASSFSGGLTEVLLAAFDQCEKQVGMRQDYRSCVTQAVTALGDLLICIANQVFHEDDNLGNDTNENVFNSQQSTRSGCDDQDRQPAVMFQSHDEIDQVHSEVVSRTPTNSAMNEFNNPGRISSVQQRRSMLLALMTRARRGGAGSVDESDVAGMIGDATMAPVNGLGEGSPFAFAGTSGLESNWDNVGRVPRAGGCTENSRLLDSFTNDPSLANVMPGSRANEQPSRVLDSIVRGQGEVQAGPRSAAGKALASTVISSLIANGLLGNSLRWVQAVVAAQPGRNTVGGSNREKVFTLQNSVDDDGTPLLMLAISLGCSEPIIRFLISQGAPVSEKELKTAALTNQPRILSILLDHCVYVQGVIEHDLCSPAVVHVLEAAAAGQAELQSRMRACAEEFFPLVLNRILQLGLASRRLHSQSTQMCGKSVTHALVGNVLLNSLHEHQCNSARSQQPGTLETNSSNHANPADSGRFGVGNQAQGFVTTSGLLCAVPIAMFQRALFQQSDDVISPLITYLLLVEDHLCNQGLDSAGAGLALLSILLKLFPKLAKTDLVDRFGFADLVSFHEYHASSRLTQLSSHGAMFPGTSRNGNPKLTIVDGRPGAIRCGRNHFATIHITRHSSFRCDICGKAVERGRPMHGCRDCDWDACELCTDKAEGGIVKWLKVKELATECHQLLLAEDDSLLRETVDAACSAIDRLCSKDDVSELIRLSTRLLQHDAGALRQLASMLETPGCIAAHQFVTIVLPSLHSSLLGGRSEIAQHGVGPRCKRAKVVFPGRGKVEACPPFGENRQFCKLAFESLIVNHQNTESKDAGNRQNSESKDADPSRVVDGVTRQDPPRDDDIDEDDEDSDDEKKPDTSAPHEIVPEFVRRLHQVLSFYEGVSVVKAIPACNQHAAHGGSTGVDLQALTQPLELTLCPSFFGRPASPKIPIRQLSILVEPLTKMNALEKLILSTFRIVNPAYVEFCRRLAEDKAIIAEKPSTSSSKTEWKLGRVESYDEEIGAHRICYASGLLDCDIGVSIPGLRIDSVLRHVSFEVRGSSVILATREFVVLKRRTSGDNEPSERGAVSDIESVLNECGSSDVEALFLTRSCSSRGPNICARVESTVTVDENWLPHTVISVDTISSLDHVRLENPRFTLVSDDGIVHHDVPANQIRGLEGSPSAVRERLERAFGADSVFENRAASTRPFPFVSGRRENVDARRPSQGNETLRATVLKRSWSALSSVEAMNPVELSPCGDESSTRVTSQLRCVIGERKADILADSAAIEYTPILRVCFSTNDTLPTIDVACEATLIAALHQLCTRDERSRDHPILVGQSYHIFFSIKAVPKRSERWSSSSIIPMQSLESVFVAPLTREPLGISSIVFPTNSASISLEPSTGTWSVPNRSRKLSLSNLRSEEYLSFSDGICEGLDEICVQCLEVLSLLAEWTGDGVFKDGNADKRSVFVSEELSQKLVEQLEDPLAVVGGALPDWCTVAPSFAPRVFSYESRRLLLVRAAFGVSRSALRQQEAKVNVGPLRKRMTALRGRAVELVGEAFSGGAEDPTALQLQADELYGMEEALAARVKAAFRAQRWDERALQVAKAAVRRESLLHDAAAVMAGYASDPSVCRRRLEVRFEGESGFDAASGDEAGVTRGFYADAAEALLSCDHVAGAFCNNVCAGQPVAHVLTGMPLGVIKESVKLPLWIPDVDASGQVVIPTPRADPNSGLGVYPRPLSAYHPQIKEVLVQFRFMGRLFAAATRDGFMFPVPLSAAFLKLVQHAGLQSHATVLNSELGTSTRRVHSHESATSRVNQLVSDESDECTPVFARESILSSAELPRPGFLGGEVFAVEMHICRALDDIDDYEPPLSGHEIERRYRTLASDQHFARAALGKSYDCSFEDYFQDRTFVDPLDPSQGELASPLCHRGHEIPVTICNIREWVALAKLFTLHDGVIAQARAFREGVDDFFPSEFLRVFTPDELQRDVCGVGDNVDCWDEQSIRNLFKLDGGKGAAEALIAVASIGGEGGVALSRRFGSSSTTLTYLVKALLEASPRQRRQFLSFVTSVPIATPGLIEIVPMVAPTGEFLPMRDPGCLPRANTCARRLYLPKFESFESFSEVLWAVVREESKFKGFYEWRG